MYVRFETDVLQKTSKKGNKVIVHEESAKEERER